jgi:hypothetical protein
MYGYSMYYYLFVLAFPKSFFIFGFIPTFAAELNMVLT